MALHFFPGLFDFSQSYQALGNFPRFIWGPEDHWCWLQGQLSIPAWRIPWTEGPGGLQSLDSHRVWHDWSDWTHTHTSSSKTLLHLRGVGGSDQALLTSLHQRNQKLLIPVNFVFKENSLDQASFISKNIGKTEWTCPSPFRDACKQFSEPTQPVSRLASPPLLPPWHPSAHTASPFWSLGDKLIHFLSQSCGRPGQWVPAKSCWCRSQELDEQRIFPSPALTCPGSGRGWRTWTCPEHHGESTPGLEWKHMHLDLSLNVSESCKSGQVMTSPRLCARTLHL